MEKMTGDAGSLETWGRCPLVAIWSCPVGGPLRTLGETDLICTVSWELLSGMNEEMPTLRASPGHGACSEGKRCKALGA